MFVFVDCGLAVISHHISSILLINFVKLITVAVDCSGVITTGEGGQLPPGAAGEGAQNRGRKSGFYAIC